MRIPNLLKLFSLLSGITLLASVGCGPAKSNKTVNNTNNLNNNNTTGPCTNGELRCDASGTSVEICSNGYSSGHCLYSIPR